VRELLYTCCKSDVFLSFFLRICVNSWVLIGIVKFTLCDLHVCQSVMVVTHRFIGFPSFFVCQFTTLFFVSEFKVLEFVDAYPFPVFYLVAEPGILLLSI
jgi:hypothetical protein